MSELDETTDIELLPDYPIVTFGNGHTCRIKRIYKLGPNQYGRELKAIKLFRNDIFMRINNIPKSYLNENLLRVLVYSDEFIELTDDNVHYRHYLSLKDFWGNPTKVSSLYEHLLSKIREQARLIKDLKIERGNLHQALARKNIAFLKSHDETTWEELRKAKKVADILIASSPQLAEKVLRKDDEE